MKLLLAIVNNDDAGYVNEALEKAGFMVTKIASTGGFLLKGNTTFMIGVDDADVDRVFDIIGKYSKKRTVPISTDPVNNPSALSSVSAKVTVGGATVFVLNVERFEHI
ncbi:MAG: transcriptional regulator [Ruminococcaceae bacterium]|nr:transcriptional regulator [Oscillospiraceae bacterium]